MKIKYISIRTKFAFVTGMAALSIWLVLFLLRNSVSGALLNIANSHVFSVTSREALGELRSAHESVEQTTRILANSKIIYTQNIDGWIENLPVLVEILESNPQAYAVYMGNAKGDFFIIRRLDTDRLKQTFNSPINANYSLDYINGTNINKPVRYFYNKSQQLIEKIELPLTDYDPRSRPWYKDAVVTSETVTTSPYVFFFAKEVGVTVAHAADIRTVVASDIFLSSIAQSLREIRSTPSSELLLHIDGNVLAWTGEIEPLIESSDGTFRQRKLDELDFPALTEIANDVQPKGWLVNKTTLEFADGLSPELIILVPKEELLAEYKKLRIMTFLFSFIILFLLVPLTWFCADILTRPIRKLHYAIENASVEDLDFTLPETVSNDEIGDLHKAMHNMQSLVKKHVKKLAIETRSRERVESELNIATRIQRDLVPGSGYLHTNIAQDKIYALLVPAKAVGGDLYELIPLSDTRFFIAVGDVSDKGVPAALFMSRTIALTKILVPKTSSLSELLSEINNQLALGNDSCMFVTLFCAIIDTSNGMVNYSSAGHNPPVVVSKGSARFLDVEASPPLGIFEDTEYSESVLQLNSGDSLVAYSDGITEAFDEDKNEFSEQRLINALSRYFDDVEEIGNKILGAVSEFTQDVPQSDDITIMIVGHS